MIDIRPYIKISETSLKIAEAFSTAEQFHATYKLIPGKERKAILNHYIVNNMAYGFYRQPIVLEKIKEYLADVLSVNSNCIKLIGSAKTGFSLGGDENGKIFVFDGTRDLDFTIINDELFNGFVQEYENWVFLYQKRKINPTVSEENSWRRNLQTGKNQIDNKFFDLKYIPNRDQFPLKSNTAEALYRIKIKLAEYYSLDVKLASIRVYQTWEAFMKMLELNTNKIVTGV